MMLSILFIYLKDIYTRSGDVVLETQVCYHETQFMRSWSLYAVFQLTKILINANAFMQTQLDWLRTENVNEVRGIGALDTEVWACDNI